MTKRIGPELRILTNREPPEKLPDSQEFQTFAWLIDTTTPEELTQAIEATNIGNDPDGLLLRLLWKLEKIVKQKEELRSGLDSLAREKIAEVQAAARMAQAVFKEQPKIRDTLRLLSEVVTNYAASQHPRALERAHDKAIATHRRQAGNPGHPVYKE